MWRFFWSVNGDMHQHNAFDFGINCVYLLVFIIHQNTGIISKNLY